MMQALKRDGIFVYDFNQGKERAEADRTFQDVIIGRRLGHTGDDALRRHIGNAKGKTQKDEDSKVRMIKKAPHRPIDLGVAASMAVARCLYYNL
jgi:phage terminase large subunit-like protein